MPTLDIKSPVPSDIVIARAATPLPIVQIARQAGIREEELDLYGATKAKVHLSVLERLATGGQSVHGALRVDSPVLWPGNAVTLQ